MILSNKSIWQQRQALMKDKNFILFILYSFITVTAKAMCYIILIWHVMQYNTHNTLFNSIIMSLSFWLPSVVLSPFSGVIVDQFERKKVLFIANSIRATCFISIGLILQHIDQLWICSLLNAINGCIWATLGPALSAFIRELVNDEELLAANTNLDVCIEIANIAGMGIASLLIIILTTSQALLGVGLMIIIGMIILTKISIEHEQQHHNQDKQTFWLQFKMVINYLKPRPILALLYLLNEVLFLQFMLSPILLAPLIKTTLHGTGKDFSLTELSLSAGIIIGSFILPWLTEKIGRIKCLFGSIIWISFLFFLVSQAKQINTLMIIYGLLGLGLPVWSIIASFTQEYTEKSMQGRMQSIFNTIGASGMLLLYTVLAICHDNKNTSRSYWFAMILGLISIMLLIKIKRNQEKLITNKQSNLTQ